MCIPLCLEACFGHLSLPEVPDWSSELLLEVFWAAACGVFEDLCSRFSDSTVLPYPFSRTGVYEACPFIKVVAGGDGEGLHFTLLEYCYFCSL